MGSGTRQYRSEDDAVSSAEQLWLLAEPTRYAIHNAVAWGGALTIREISDRLGKKPASLYRHIEQMCESGLLRTAGMVEVGRRSAQTYVARRKLRYSPGDADEVAALCHVVDRGARHAAQSFRTAAESMSAVTSGRGRTTHFSPPSGWMTSEELGRANDLIEELRELFIMAERRPGTRLIELTVIMAPTRSAEG